MRCRTCTNTVSEATSQKEKIQGQKEHAIECKEVGIISVTRDGDDRGLVLIRSI